jgi:hypothetical protein
MIKLISGALVGTSNYNDIYDDDKYDDENDDGDDNHDDTTDGQNVTDHLISNIKQGIPTMQKIANKIAKLEKTKLDEKQYIAYENDCMYLPSGTGERCTGFKYGIVPQSTYDNWKPIIK